MQSLMTMLLLNCVTLLPMKSPSRLAAAHAGSEYGPAPRLTTRRVYRRPASVTGTGALIRFLRMMTTVNFLEKALHVDVNGDKIN